MKAVVVTSYGDPSVLQVRERPTPVCGAEEVLIHVKAAGVNRPDIMQRQGRYPAPAGAPPDILGLEVAGVVVDCGANVTQWKVGDAVCALLAGGGYAEMVAAPAGQCLAIPSGVSFSEAAGLPETVFTVWHNVFQRGQLKAGETLLVHGGSSGIGVTAIQLAKAFGAEVIVTVGSDDKGQACLDLGADQYINYKTTDFEQVVASTGVDVILDMVGGEYFGKNLSILRPDGRLVYINAMQGNEVVLPIMKMMLKRITVTGSTLRSREIAFKAALAAEVQQQVWPLLQHGQFKSLVYATFPLAEASQAHALMESSHHIGKIILVNEGA
ncbi:MAG: NAD(P)H-quinone oxidoreductase [Spirosomataceae bacterium]